MTPTPDDRLELLRIMEEYAPQGDGLDLLQALVQALPGSFVDVRTFVSPERPEEPYPVVSMTVRPENLMAFLNALRSGVTVTDAGEDAKIITLQRN